jgi:DNA polymerase/3'-5' exonuclease PolX
LVESLRKLARLHTEVFKKAAFFRAAKAIEKLPAASFRKHYKRGTWQDIPGIGKGLESRITEFVEKGRIKELNKLTRERRKKQKRKPISRKTKIRRSKAKPVIKYILKILKPTATATLPTGSWRRGKKLLGDIEFLVTGTSTDKIYELIDRSRKIRVKSVMWKGKQKLALHVTTADIRSFQLEFRVVSKKYWGGALLETTGSGDFNIWMRRVAKKKGYKLNNLGLWKGSKLVAGRSEKRIFKILGLDYIEPRDREKPPSDVNL